jgi:hypothetical protein
VCVPLLLDELLKLGGEPKPLLPAIIAAITREPTMVFGFFCTRAWKHDDEFKPIRTSGLKLRPALLRVAGAPSDLGAFGAGSHDVDKTDFFGWWIDPHHSSVAGRASSGDRVLFQGAAHFLSDEVQETPERPKNNGEEADVHRRFREEHGPGVFASDMRVR